MSGISSDLAGSGWSASDRLGTTTTYQCGSRTVVEHNYALPKGQHSNLVGSFSYRQPSLKAGRLKAQVAVQKRKLQELEAEERTSLTRLPKKKAVVRAKIRYLEDQLIREMASLTEVHVNVSELDD